MTTGNQGGTARANSMIVARPRATPLAADAPAAGRRIGAEPILTFDGRFDRGPDTVRIGDDLFLFGPGPARLGDAAGVAAFESALASAALVDFFRLWCGLVRERSVPTRRQMTPQLLRRHLPCVGIMELAASGDEVRVRLLGTSLTELLGREGRGRALRELIPRANATELMTRIWQPFFTSAAPRLDIGTLGMLDRSHVRYRALHVPVADDAGCVRFSYFRVLTNLDEEGRFGAEAD